MIGQTGKLLCLMMTVLFALGLISISGCDRDENTPAPQIKTRVVSKQIAQPSRAKQTPGVQEKSITADHGKPVPEKEDKQRDETSSSGPAVTEEQAKREKTDALNLKGKALVEEDSIVGPLFRSQEKYDFKGRVDPFIPLVNEKREGDVAAEKEEKTSAPKRILTPLEKMDLSQIKLVAVIQTTKDAIAMVEEASGKGYEVRIGTYMGRNEGRVVAINPNGLSIKEYYKDFKGQRRERVQELNFHRNEGGE